MQVSSRGRYGLTAMIDIAVFSENETLVTLKSIAERHNISIAYLEQIVVPLKKAGLLKSIRGSKGGYLLGMDSALIKVGDILRLLDEKLSITSCDEKESTCVDNCKLCASKLVWITMSETINNVADSITLEHLAYEYRENLANYKQ